MIKITGKLPTLNEYIELERRNKFLAAKLKKAYTNLISAQVRIQTKEKLSGLYDVYFYWHVSGKADPDNIYHGVKYVLDGCVKSGYLKNDNQKHVKRNIHDIIKSDSDYVIVKFVVS